MHVGVFVLVVSSKRIQHTSRFLRRCGAVKVDQRMAVRLFAEDREIFANGVPVYGASCDLVHTLICSMRQCAPPYSRIKLRVTQRSTSSSRFCLAWTRVKPLPLANQVNPQPRNNL